MPGSQGRSNNTPPVADLLDSVMDQMNINTRNISGNNNSLNDDITNLELNISNAYASASIVNNKLRLLGRLPTIAPINLPSSTDGLVRRYN